MVARGAGGPFGGGGLLPLLLLVILVSAYLRGGLPSPIQNASRDPVGFLGFIVAIALGITVHEFMHAWTAHRLGDDTGRLTGRMSLDPRAHLDLYGSLLIVFLGFGYGRPVPFNEARLRPGALGVSLVALAGPLTNVALAAIAAIPLRAGAADIFGGTYERILLLVVVYNAFLAVFNLIPIPPLDGSNVIYGLLPPRQRWSWRSYAQYGPFIILAVIFLLPYLGIDLVRPLVLLPGCGLAQFLAGVPVC